MKNPTELFKRLVTGAIGISVLVFLVLYPFPVYFSLVVIIITILAAWEYFNILFSEKDFGLKVFGTGLSVSASIGMYAFGHSIFLPLVPAVIFMVFIYALFCHRDITSASGLIGKTVLGVLYIGLFLSYAIGIRTFENGGWWLLFLFSIIWMNDTFAFFAGKGFGRTKLAPVISPNKTMEGAAAGLAGGVITAIVFNTFFLKELSASTTILLAVSLGVLCQLGDLFESMLKRGAGVKDSGSIIPGHGGILDRIDSIIIPLPFFYYYLIIIG